MTRAVLIESQNLASKAYFDVVPKLGDMVLSPEHRDKFDGERRGRLRFPTTPSVNTKMK